jgi:sugar lactone lactonase YvrE
MTDIRRIVPCRNTLGEGPVWDAAEQAIHWVDIKGQLLQRFHPASGDSRVWTLPERIGSFALRERGGFVVALASGFAFLSEDGAVDWIARPAADRPGIRFNDGKCDSAGRFWAGTMNEAGPEPTGALYRLDPDLTVTEMETGIGISNALSWSPDHRTLYFADTRAEEVRAYDYDVATGAIANRRVFASTAGRPGSPDGSTVDAEGCLWNAEWDGWCLVRYTPDGRVDRILDLPVQRPTSCAFGGPDLRTLYITTAVWDATPEEIERQPWAGSLLAVDVDVPGLPAARFRG